MSGLTKELNLLTEALRSRIPCSIDSPENLKLEANLKKAMADFFLSMEKGFPYHLIPKAYDLNVKEVSPPVSPPSIPSGWEDWLNNFVKGSSALFADRLAAQLARIYIEGNIQIMSYGK